MTITEHLEAMMKELVKMDRKLADWQKNPNRKPFTRAEVAIGSVLGNRIITPEGAWHLRTAAELLLRRTKLQARISVRTAVRCLDDEIQAEIVRVREKSRWSLDAVVARATAALHKVKTFSGDCFFPAIITGNDQQIDLRYGPVRIISRQQFEGDIGVKISDAVGRLKDTERQYPTSRERILSRWGELSAPYTAIVVVSIEGFELDMARPVARQGAEFALNLLRMMARRRDGRAIRLSGDTKPEIDQAFLAMDTNGEFFGSLHMGGEGAILPEDWSEILNRSIGPAHSMVAGIADRLVNGDSFTDPIVERIRYANQLFTEAFQDAEPRLALVKIVSGLEALTVLPKENKARNLELRCAIACSGGDPEYFRNVRLAISSVYNIRNKVVHGDAPGPHDSETAIAELQKYLFDIVLHLWRVLVLIYLSDKPQSIKPLRKLVAAAYHEQRLQHEKLWEHLGIANPCEAKLAI